LKPDNITENSVEPVGTVAQKRQKVPKKKQWTWLFFGFWQELINN
jgi:hypothetical protein